MPTLLRVIMGFTLSHSTRIHVEGSIMDEEMVEFYRVKREALDLVDFCKRRDNCGGCPFYSNPLCIIHEPAMWEKDWGLGK